MNHRNRYLVITAQEGIQFFLQVRQNQMPAYAGTTD
jgi:hypothetical protein